MNLDPIPTSNPSGPTTEDWRARALCAQTDPEAFFPDKGESATAAKRTCLSCAVRVPCLEWALKAREPHGVWGGLSALQRRHLARQRRINDNAPDSEPEEAA